jgi:hypothetical protein
MKFSKLKIGIILLVCISIVGCTSIPKDFMKLPEGYLEKRQLQIRKYETTEEEKIISAVAGVLQDLGFTLDESESKIGLVVASKKADATSGAQVAGAILLDFLSALGGSPSNNCAKVDKIQHVKSSVIVKPSLEEENKTLVRVTFQRIIWNASNQINRVETIDEPEIYQKFFDSLSKSVFLEAHKI